MKILPDGAYPVMLTPFHHDERIDWSVLEDYAEWLIGRRSAGLFPVALSGEMYQLSEEERLAVARRVVETAAGRTPVVASIVEKRGGDALVNAARRMASTGVDAVVLVASVLLAETEDEQVLRDKVEHLLTELPEVNYGIYECPLPYHRVLSIETVAWLAGTGRFVFFKETSHDVAVMEDRVRVSEGTPMKVFNAGIESLVESLQVGVSGLSGWVVNVYPELVQWIVENPYDERAAPLQAALDRVERGMAATYPGSAKALVEQRATLGINITSRWRPGPVDECALAALAFQAETAGAAVASDV